MFFSEINRDEGNFGIRKENLCITGIGAMSYLKGDKRLEMRGKHIKQYLIYPLIVYFHFLDLLIASDNWFRVNDQRTQNLVTMENLEGDNGTL